jgi:hypothetical protein
MRQFGRYWFHSFNDWLRFQDDARFPNHCTVVPMAGAIRIAKELNASMQ